MGSDALGQLINVLQEAGKNGITDRAVVGFDGFIDRISRVVKVREDRERFTPFATISEFGNRIREAAGKSCDLEYVTEMEKIGGNSPIMAHALARLGIATTLLGAIGYPEICPVFRQIDPHCRIIPISSPSFCTALEFSDGKVMLSDLKILDEVNWKLLTERVPRSTLREIFEESRLVGFLNWSQLSAVETIWEGVLTEIVLAPNFPTTGERFLFVDLADLSKKTSGDVRRAFALIGRFSGSHRVFLGMNENETRLVQRAHFPEDPSNRLLLQAVEKIFGELSIEGIVVHLVNECFMVSRQGTFQARGTRIFRPKLLTGGGDNFNAGFCFGLLLGQPYAHCLILGTYTAGYYVREGQSANLPVLIDELRQASFEPCNQF
ncbi:MAG TPA: hypothetical protein VLH40_05900 [Atribacteraceae bacterium]|nr:hypothetical protein [Atribacteraceae bacterium]